MDHLPDEQILQIFEYLSIEDLLSIREVCRKFNYVCSYQNLWKVKFRQRFPWAWSKIQLRFNKMLEELIWTNETVAALKINYKLSNILNSLSFKLYKFKQVTSPILNSVLKLTKIGSFGALIVINELRAILRKERDRNFTTAYYCRRIFYEVAMFLNEEQFRNFLKAPQDLQSIERGVFYFNTWFQIYRGYEMEFEEMCSKLDCLAEEVRLILRESNCDHPALSLRLFSSDESLLHIRKWSQIEFDQIFWCINYILFKKHEFRPCESNNVHFMRATEINKVLEKKLGTAETLSIVYKVISHRLGIPLQLVSIGENIMLKWSNPVSMKEEFINTYTNGEKIFNVENFKAVSTPEILMRMADSIQDALQRIYRLNDGKPIFYAARMKLFLAQSIGIANERYYCDLFRSFIKLEGPIEAIVSSVKNQPKSRDFEVLFEEAEKLLEIERKGPKPFTPKRRRSENDQVKFATGMIVKHKISGMKCVIYGWDEVKSNQILAEEDISDLELKENQPFYYVLLLGIFPLYVGQENLILMTKPNLMIHAYQTGKYFKSFDGNFYVPNEELESEYPDDESIRNMFSPLFVKE